MPDLTGPFTPGFTPAHARELGSLFRVLSSPARLRVLHILATEGPAYGAELAARVDLAQPTMVHHMAALRRAGLVVWEKRGHEVWHRLDPAGIARLAAALGLPELDTVHHARERR